MTRLVFVTQVLDASHPTLGATAAKVRALAALVDEVVVVAARAAEGALPPNGRFRSFAAPTQALRGARFEAVLAGELVRGRPLAVLAHMAPIYALLSAPAARVARVPLLLWFTHWKASRKLAAAERVVDRVLSVDRATFPLPSGKLLAVGHGIDLSAFPCTPPPDGPLRLLALGRYSRSKGLPALLRAVAAARAEGVDVSLTAHGPALSPNDRVHLRELEALREALDLADAIRLGGPLPAGDVPGALAAVHALVNNMRPGAADKVVYEAAAACRPAFAASDAFASLLPDELRFPSDDHAALAERLASFAALPAERHRALGEGLRERVRERHSVEHWAEAVLAAVG